MAVAISPPPYPNHPLYLQQGGSWSSKFIFGHGKISHVKTASIGVSPSVETRDRHCLSAGDWVHLSTPDSCCNLIHGVYEVTGVPDEVTVELEHRWGQESVEATDGWLTRAIDLRGFEVKGVIATRNPLSPSPPNLIGAIAANDDTILVQGNVDVAIRDQVRFPEAGINQAFVTGVYEGSLESGEVYSLITLDQQATVTIPEDSPVKFYRAGGVLGEFDFSIEDDPRCGVVRGQIDADLFSSIPLPGDCCGSAFEIGCYQIVLCQGALAPRATYPQASYVSWKAPFSAGPVYLRTGLI